MNIDLGTNDPIFPEMRYCYVIATVAIFLYIFS